MKNFIFGLTLVWALSASWIAIRSKQDLAQLLSRNAAVEAKSGLDLRIQSDASSSMEQPKTDAETDAFEDKLDGLQGTAEPVKPKRQPDSTNKLRNFIADTRVKVVGKFVQLSETQREELKKLYLEQKQRRLSSSSPEMKDRLAQIIGKDNAEFFSSQRQAAFERRKSEEQLKQVLLLSRELSLNAEQEAKLTQSMKFVEKELENFDAADPAAVGVTFEGSPEDKMRFYIERSQLEAELLRSQVEKFLEPNQYKKYLEIEAQSEASDMTLWH